MKARKANTYGPYGEPQRDPYGIALSAGMRVVPFCGYNRSPRRCMSVTIIPAASQRLTWWQIYAKPQFPALATAALRLLSVHVSTCASERNWSAWGRLFDDPRRSGLDMASAEKLIFIQTNDELAANYDSVDQSNQQDVAISLF
ncbi:hypothetical protein QJQ45_017481 [Haematococcus lacustris]|nr:hypothetical protein QJQ45_017481 [Haematococcus lacustris]